MSGANVVTPSATSLSSVSVGGDDDDVGCRACYGVVVACLSLLLFCVLADTIGVVRACPVTGLAVAFFAFVGWLALPCSGTTPTEGGGGDAARARRTDGAARYACWLVGAAAAAVHVPPAFAYECAGTETGGGGGNKLPAGALCPVCLEDVQRGEMVRWLPACGHLFHSACVDAWLRSHATCPLCRSDLSPPNHHGAAKSAAAPGGDGAVAPSSTNVLPRV